MPNPLSHLRDALLSRLLHPATLAYFAESKARGIPLWQRLHGYVYARWAWQYIGILSGRHPLGRLLAPLEGLARRLGLISLDTYKRYVDGYHGKVLPVGTERQVIKIERPIDVRLPESVLPYPRAREIILEAGADICVIDCPCRLSTPEHCTPTDVCILVGKVVVEFMLAHNPDKSRRISADTALAIIRDAQRRGNVTHAFFKDAVINRFYAICNCCPCCCVALQAHRNGVPTLASSGHVAALDARACAGCGLCVRKCAFGAISLATAPPQGLEGQDAQGGTAHIDTALCMGCGVCALNCPAGALRLVRAPERGEPLDVAATPAPPVN